MTIKKLVILILVLGMASLANADLSGIELSVNGVTDGPGNVTEVDMPVCEEIVIGVVGPFDYQWLGYVIIEGAFPGAGGEWGDELGPPYEPSCSGYYYEAAGYPIISLYAGSIASAYRYEENGWGFGYEFYATADLPVVTGGTEFELLYHCCGPAGEYVTITLWDDAEGYDVPQDTIITFCGIPEPATIILLGLGGLGLLRWRKH